jgi:two-component system, OmpR family, sensor histidine kinase VicK
MTPVRLSVAWYRRFYSVIAVIGAFYFLPTLLHTTGVVTMPDQFHIPVFAAVIAAMIFIAAVVCAVITKKIPSYILATILFIAVLLLSAFVVYQTGYLASPYLAFWAVVVFFSPLFGAYGWLPVVVAAGSYMAGSYISRELDLTVILLTVASTILPLIGGAILWRGHGDTSEESTNSNVKNLANQLSEVAQKSEIIINAIGDGVLTVDGRGIIQLINPAAQEILGWGKQDALMLNHKSILKLVDENNNELDDTANPIQQVLNTNQQMRANKLTGITQSGKKISLSLVASPIGTTGSGAIAVFRDVTKERAEEREQAEFISTASHEMRTPVASIEGYLGLAMNPATATVDARGQGYIMKAHEAAQHLGRLFQDLLDVSKSEDGRLSNNPKVVDITSFTATIVEGLQQKASDKGLTLNFVPASQEAAKKILPVYYVNQDNDHIREVLDNLIENAIKYTPKGTVSVDVSGSSDSVVVSVTDSGLGIPAEDIPHLFQKFYRVDNMDRQEIGGTGLGLYLSRRLIEAMQGRIWVESTFGKGSTFFVELPRLESQQAEILKQQQATQAAMQAQQQASQPAPAPLQAMATPQAQPTPATQPTQPVAAAPTATQAPTPSQTPEVKAATTVPRGESLTREQIAARVRQLEELAKQQREQQNTRQ